MTRQLFPARPALAATLIVAAALAVALVALARPAHAVVTVSPASNGTGISADDAGGAWTDLGAITITENLMDDFAASQAGVTLIFTAPAGFEFNTAQATNVTSTGTDLSALAVAYPSSTTLELTFTTDGVADDMDSVVIGGGTAIQVRPTAGTPLASGEILRASGVPGGTAAAIPGITADVTDFGSLSVVAGTVAQLAVTTQPGNATAGAVFGQQPAVRTEDQFGNPSTSGLAASLNVTATINAGTGPLQGTAALDIGTGAGNGSVTYTNLRIDVAQAGVTLDFAAAGLSTATSAAFAVGPDSPTTLVLVTEPSASTAAGVAFAQQPVVQLRDGFDNLVTTDSSTVVTATLTTGTGTLSGTVTETAASGVANFAGNGLSIDLPGTNKVLTFSAGGLTSDASAAFTITSTVPSVDTSTIEATPGSVPADDTTVATVTVQLKDGGGTNLGAGGDTVTLATTLGTLSAVTDNGDGTYSATLTSSTTGNATVSGTVNAADITDTAAVVFSAPESPPPGGSTGGDVDVALEPAATGNASTTSEVDVSTTAGDGSSATVSIPAAALPAGSTLALAAVADAAELAAKAAPPSDVDLLLGFSITAADADGEPVTDGFGSPVALEFTVDASTLPAGAASSDLRIAFWNGSSWVPLDSVVVVNADGTATISASTTHFSIFSVVHDDAGFGRLDGTIPTDGVGFVTYRGSLGELATTLSSAGCVTPAFATVSGAWVQYLAGAPFPEINAVFVTIFEDGIPLDLPLAISNCGA
jgi:adhesin/invasin